MGDKAAQWGGPGRRAPEVGQDTAAEEPRCLHDVPKGFVHNFDAAGDGECEERAKTGEFNRWVKPLAPPAVGEPAPEPDKNDPSPTQALRTLVGDTVAKAFLEGVAKGGEWRGDLEAYGGTVQINRQILSLDPKLRAVRVEQDEPVPAGCLERSELLALLQHKKEGTPLGDTVKLSGDTVCDIIRALSYTARPPASEQNVPPGMFRLMSLADMVEGVELRTADAHEVADILRALAVAPKPDARLREALERIQKEIAASDGQLGNSDLGHERVMLLLDRIDTRASRALAPSTEEKT